MTEPSDNQFTGFTARRPRARVESGSLETPTRVPSAPIPSGTPDTEPPRTPVPLQLPRLVLGSPNNPFAQELRNRPPSANPPRESAPLSASQVFQDPASTVRNPEPGPPTPDTNQIIALLARTLELANKGEPKIASERNNVRDPDQFDGSEPNKLRSFFTQLELVFRARPRTFDTDERKVTYAISFLRGTALQWFEPYLLEGMSDNPPVFMSDYSAFQEELRVNFGPYDATGAAEHDLENLRMADNQRIAKYITQFSRLATQVRWGPAALRYQFYRGLPDRLKDRISEVGKPNTLSELRELAQSLDHRYWERRAERSRETSGTSKSGGKSGSNSNSNSEQRSSGQSSSSASRTPQKSSDRQSGTPSSKASGNKSKSDKTPPKPYADKLGKDGKLTPEERQRRISKGLCLFCGEAGHSANACPKKSNPQAKARAAQATPAPDSETPAPQETKN